MKNHAIHSHKIHVKIIMQNESITEKSIGLHFHNKYAEQAILALLEKNFGIYAVIFDHFPPPDVDIAITDCLPLQLERNHNIRAHQSIFFLGNSASKGRVRGRNIHFIHLRTPLKKIIEKLSEVQQYTSSKDNIITPYRSLSVREQIVIDHLKSKREYSEMSLIATQLDHKKYSYYLRSIMKKMGFNNKLQLYKWIVKM